MTDGHAKIIALSMITGLLLILSYLSMKVENSGIVPLIFLFAGLALTFILAVSNFSDSKK